MQKTAYEMRISDWSSDVCSSDLNSRAQECCCQAHARVETHQETMPDLSHPTSRVLDVITFLAGHPTEEFSLADIAQQTAMSKASAHRVQIGRASCRARVCQYV